MVPVLSPYGVHVRKWNFFQNCTNLYGFHIEITKFTVVRLCTVGVYPLLARINPLCRYLSVRGTFCRDLCWRTCQTDGQGIACKVDIQLFLFFIVNYNLCNMLRIFYWSEIPSSGESRSGFKLKVWHWTTRYKTQALLFRKLAQCL